MNLSNLFSFIPSVLFLVILSSVVIFYYTKQLKFSILTALIKYSFCLIYFLVWINYRPVVLLDDQTYFEQSIVIYEDSKGSLPYLFSFESIAYIASLAGGSHFGYYIYVFISFIFFGPYYYSPVILNVFFSVLTGAVLYKTLVLAGLNKRFCMFFIFFFLLHWDIITWSSFINLKDIFVLFLVVSALNCLIGLRLKKRKLWTLIILATIAFILLVFRFYLVYFLLVTGIVYFIMIKMYKIQSRWTGPMMRFLVLVLMPVGFYIIFVRMFSSSLAELGGATNVVFGFFRFIFTPLPYSIEENYSFLLISSILHWLMLPLFFYGVYLFIKRHFIALMPFLILTLLLCVFYGSFGELQGPRHRVLLLYFITLAQALALYELLNILVKPKQNICVESLAQQ